MAVAKKKKRFLLFYVLLIGGVVFLYNYGKPKNRFTRDAYNPSTRWGLEVKNYLAAGYSKEAVAGILVSHFATKSPQYQAYIDKGWALTQG
jgi:hypothetical protein